MATGGFCSTGYFTLPIYDGYGGVPLSTCGFGLMHDYKVCLDNRTGNAWASHDDVGSWRANACPYRGNILATVTSDESGTPQGAWSISEDYYRWWKYDSSTCDMWWWDDCPYIKLAITEATGDGYNWRFLVFDP